MQITLFSSLVYNNLLLHEYIFGILKYVCDIAVKKLTFAISFPDEFLFLKYSYTLYGRCIASRSIWSKNEKHNTKRTF